jgi:hypothetical protein
MTQRAIGIGDRGTYKPGPRSSNTISGVVKQTGAGANNQFLLVQDDDAPVGQLRKVRPGAFTVTQSAHTGVVGNDQGVVSQKSVEAAAAASSVDEGDDLV